MDKRNIKEILWEKDALEHAYQWGLDREDVEAVVRFPTRNTLDPYTVKVGHPVVNHFRGDVRVTVGYLNPEYPKVLHVVTETGFDPQRGGHRSATAGAGSGSSLPTSIRQLRKRILDLGYNLTRDNHAKVLTKDGKVIYTLPGTVSDHHSIANSWRSFLKVHTKQVLKQEEGTDAVSSSEH